MQTVSLVENSLDPETWETHEVEDVRAFLKDRFGDKFPDTGRIYHNEVNTLSDVTPADEDGIERLGQLEGRIIVVIYPGDPVTILVAVVAVVAVAAAAFLMMPIPNATVRNDQAASPNNELTERTNRPRPNGRIPDIFGTVRSTPDLLAVPYKVFKDHREVEVAYLCIGRGEYEILDVYDDVTPVEEIEGMKVEIYGPDTSPLSGDAPQMSIGDPIDDELLNVKRSTAVNGQTLFPPNYKKLVGTDNVRADDGSYKFQIRDTSVFAWPQLFEAGDEIVVTNGTVDGKALSGTYIVLSVTNDDLVLDNPQLVNGAWSSVTGATSWYGPTIQVVEDLDIGPVYATIPAGGKLIMNVVALGGLYKMNGDQQFKQDVEVQFTLTPVDSGGTPTGSPEVFTGTIPGSATTKSLRGATIICDPVATGRFAVVAERVTDTDYDIGGTVVDEVKWRDMYIAEAIIPEDFGNVTTVFAVTYGTDGALALKDRKLNLEVTRKVAERLTGSTFGSLIATNNAAEIISHMCLDVFIGNRHYTEIDFDNIYDSVAGIETYFGTSEAAQFCYTFDKANLSFEESITAVASAVFSIAYRRGRVIKLSFEKSTEDSTLLFNHRNKLPGSETRTVRFGYQDDIDGVEFTYVDPEDDAIVTKYMPADQSAINPKKIESIGVRSHIQAHFHVNRAWNKYRFQNTTTEFTGLQQAEMLVRSDRILVADNTRSDTLDGEVLGLNLLELTLSQPVVIEGPLDHVIFLQHTDGTTQAIEIASVAPVSEDETTRIILSEPPTVPIAFGLRVNTGYVIVANDAPRSSAFLVVEREPEGNFTSKVTAVNYDGRYYQNDQDFILALI